MCVIGLAQAATQPTGPSLVDLVTSLLIAWTWPLAFGLFVYAYRKQVEAVLHEVAMLIQRIKTLKVGNVEAETQLLSPTAEAPRPEPPEAKMRLAEETEEAGFYTEEGVKRLVANSGLLTTGEMVRGALLIFQTSKQRTWFVATNERLFCLLDDSDTRLTNRVIQWIQQLGSVRDVRARAKADKPTIGLVDVGVRRSWLYSQRLFPDPSDIENATRELIDRARMAN